MEWIIDMDMRSGEGGRIKPEYIARSLQVSVEEAVRLGVKAGRFCLRTSAEDGGQWGQEYAEAFEVVLRAY